MLCFALRCFALRYAMRYAVRYASRYALRYALRFALFGFVLLNGMLVPPRRPGLA
jgi:hypothetical protein